MAAKKEFDIKKYEIDFAGKKLILETGKLAGLAEGSITLRCGDTVLLATAVIGNTPREGVDFFPLMVDYEERFYAAGKISGSRFIKREGRPSEVAVLAARKIDRPIRPLFPKESRLDVQVIITVLSYDGESDPDALSIIAASAALMQTESPYKGPIGAVVIGKVDGKLKASPTVDELEASDLYLTIAATADKVMMIEAEANEISEEEMIKAFEMAMAEIKSTLEIQKQIAKDAGTADVDIVIEKSEVEVAVKAEVFNLVGDKLKKAMAENDIEERENQQKLIEEEVLEAFEGTYKVADIKNSLYKLTNEEVRSHIIKEERRPDGRGIEEIRPLGIEVGLLPRAHGSGLFTRGDTQSLSVATLASPGMEQLLDTMEGESTKRFMHHYNFPPFSVGEVKPMRGASRRDIGHGYLAEKALRPMIPDSEEFPYTIRLVSEILSSNGSSSMAATCGSTLALMDAGVPIKKPVSGIAMGLVAADDENYKILTDLQGLEDFAGDMDFKVAGTKDGITAVQMDTKIDGLSMKIVRETFAQAKKGRLEIMDAMLEVIPEPKAEMSKYAPRIEAVQINPELIGDIIGPGGKVIKSIVEDCGGSEVTSIDIEDDGTVLISSTDPEMSVKAIKIVKSLTREIKLGEVITGKILEIKKDRMTGKEIGAIMAITPKQDGMIHISQVANRRIEKVSDIIKEGDTVTAKVMEVDKEKGRVGLSMKAVDQK